ncbi:hypothetical protein [Burkholderia sp. SCN-KJ]|uniref:TRAFAC clade GTPase domain-containing protein n=1 Tax=Burkholderia sp. SCN-KJ TaxID=2969248 RepID=UPI0021504599|nr:hypothetical protein [Burkholderia sp. SCN-KJ]MCR4470410.1 hypothetical protein [Burkholderia sp. SCN-KJ]
MELKKSKRILVLGESDVGKTNYGVQLLLRLGGDNGALQLVGAPKNVNAFKSGIADLSCGKPAQHTSSGVYEESEWVVADQNGNRAELCWPDYAGEQLTAISGTRVVSREWATNLQNSDEWMLFLRLQTISGQEDILSRPILLVDETGPKSSPSQSHDVKLVELLQILLYARGVGVAAPLAVPRMSVVLTCWDELSRPVQELTPPEALHHHLPLLTSFLSANWQSPALSVRGLSALGKPLNKDNPDQEYVDLGPEAFGFVVLPNGDLTNDLTEPVAALVRADES